MSGFVSWLSKRRVARALAYRVLPGSTRASLAAAAYDMYEDPSERFYARIYLEHILSAIRSRLSNPNPRVLDMGCGHGRLAIPLAKLGYEVLAIDKSDVALRSARMHAAEEGIAVDFRKCDIFSEVLEAGRFDVVTAIETVRGNLDQATRLLAEASKYVTDSGIFAMSIRTRYYQIACHIWNSDYQAALMVATGAGDTRWLEPGDLREILRTGGYDSIEVVGIGVISGIERDPLSLLSTPGNLTETQQRLLEQIEVQLGRIEEVSGCGRYMLALAQRSR